MGWTCFHRAFLDRATANMKIYFTPQCYGLTHFCVAIIALCVLPGAEAALMVSNLSEASTTPLHVGNYIESGGQFNLIFQNQFANSFTLGSADMALDKVSLSFAGGGSGSGLPIAIAPDASGAPANPFVFPSSGWVGLSGEQSPLTSGTYDYVPAAPLILTANTRYWLVVGPFVSGSTFNHFFADATASTSESSSSGWAIGDQLLIDQGGSPPAWSPVPNQLFKFSINASPVPEPSSACLCVIAAMVCFSRRSRCRRD